MALSEPILDAHHHIWRLAHTPWLQGAAVPRIFGPHDALRRDYGIAEYVGEAAPCGVVKSIYVQVNVAPGQEVDEVRWVQAAAEVQGFPHAITAYADLSAAQVGDVLDREMAAGNVRAIRQQLHWHETAQYRFAARPDLMNDPAWRRGLGEVHKRGLLFELQVFSGQMEHAAALARAFPALQFALLHAGMLEERAPAAQARWDAGMTRLAACPNVSVKLSGLGTFEHACSEALWRPVVARTVELFGAERCMFGSNFPIEKLWTTYARMVQVLRACLSGYTETERRAILHDTAARLYRV